MRIASVSSSRADVGPLSAVWSVLAADGHELHVVLTGMHMAPGAPAPGPIPDRARVHRCGADLGGKADAAASAALGAITADCGRVYADITPDCVLVLGDRLDMAPAAFATTLFNIPLAHLHGGEITEGAVDDRIRNAVSKLADLHLVSCAGAADRLVAMGEAADDIVITGAPGLDTLLAAPHMSRNAFLAATGLDRIRGAADGFRLVTVHPETASPDPIAPLRAVLAALDQDVAPTLITAPNSDPGGARMKQMLSDWSAGRDDVVLVDTLGSRLYPNALRHAAMMVGNSSSGIIEAGLFGLPVVDVGTRQKGRERGRNLVHADATIASVLAAVRRAAVGARTVDCPYGDGRAAARIAAALTARYRSEPAPAAAP